MGLDGTKYESISPKFSRYAYVKEAMEKFVGNRTKTLTTVGNLCKKQIFYQARKALSRLPRILKDGTILPLLPTIAMLDYLVFFFFIVTPTGAPGGAGFTSQWGYPFYYAFTLDQLIIEGFEVLIAVNGISDNSQV